MRIRKSKGIYLLVFLFEFVLGCAIKGSVVSAPQSPRLPEVKGPEVDISSIPTNTGRTVMLSNGVEIFVQNRAGMLFYHAEGTFTPESFVKLKLKNSINDEIQKIFHQLESIKGIG